MPYSHSHIGNLLSTANEFLFGRRRPLLVPNGYSFCKRASSVGGVFSIGTYESNRLGWKLEQNTISLKL